MKQVLIGMITFLILSTLVFSIHRYRKYISEAQAMENDPDYANCEEICTPRQQGCIITELPRRYFCGTHLDYLRKVYPKKYRERKNR